MRRKNEENYEIELIESACESEINYWQFISNAEAALQLSVSPERATTCITQWLYMALNTSYRPYIQYCESLYFGHE